MRHRLSPSERRRDMMNAAKKAAKAHGLYKFTAEQVAEMCEAPTTERLVRYYFTMSALRECASDAAKT